MPDERRDCETCVFQTRGRCTLTAVSRDSAGRCLHWGPRPPIGRGPLRAMEPDDLPVEHPHLDPMDKVQMLADAEMAQKRIAELEAENERLRCVEAALLRYYQELPVESIDLKCDLSTILRAAPGGRGGCPHAG